MKEMNEVKPAPAMAGTAVRDLLVILAALPILIKLIGARDLTSILQYLQSSEGATFLAVLLPILASGWRAYASYRTKKTLLETPSAAHTGPVEP